MKSAARRPLVEHIKVVAPTLVFSEMQKLAQIKEFDRQMRISGSCKDSMLTFSYYSGWPGRNIRDVLAVWFQTVDKNNEKVCEFCLVLTEDNSLLGVPNY